MADGAGSHDRIELGTVLGLDAVKLSRQRLEPWRDWGVITVANHGVLLVTALLHPHGLWLALAALPLGLGFAVGTLTVLHDAGHRMFSTHDWINAFAVQTSTPGGLWAGHWTMKHRIHHKLSQVYPFDESTRSAGAIRLHPAAPRMSIQRHQHIYAWAIYSLAWVGEIRSQLRYLRTGDISGLEPTTTRDRWTSYLSEKALWLLLLTPYAILLGVGRLVVLLILSETVASVFAAIVLVVGHINEGLTPLEEIPGRAWTRNLVATTASFSTESRVARWLTGGMTHHLAHHLRPVAIRSELPELHRTLVQETARRVELPVSEYPNLRSAVAGHARRLRELGTPEAAPVQIPAQASAGSDRALVDAG